MVTKKTPKKGYKSITVKAEVYDFFFREWVRVKDQYAAEKGVRSFSAYINCRLTELMKNE